MRDLLWDGSDKDRCSKLPTLQVIPPPQRFRWGVVHGHDRRLNNQRTRDDRSVTIATGLGVLMATLVLGALLLAILGAIFDTTNTFNTGFPWLVSIGVVAGGAYIARQRR